MSNEIMELQIEAKLDRLCNGVDVVKDKQEEMVIRWVSF